MSRLGLHKKGRRSYEEAERPVEEGKALRQYQKQYITYSDVQNDEEKIFAYYPFPSPASLWREVTRILRDKVEVNDFVNGGKKSVPFKYHTILQLTLDLPDELYEQYRNHPRFKLVFEMADKHMIQELLNFIITKNSQGARYLLEVLFGYTDKKPAKTRSKEESASTDNLVEMIHSARNMGGANFTKEKVHEKR